MHNTEHEIERARTDIDWKGGASESFLSPIPSQRDSTFQTNLSSCIKNQGHLARVQFLSLHTGGCTHLHDPFQCLWVFDWPPAGLDDPLQCN